MRLAPGVSHDASSDTGSKAHAEVPLCATTVIEPWQRERAPRVLNVLRERVQRMPELGERIHATGPGHFGYGERGIVAFVNEDRLRRILTRMLDENEILSPYGIRALSGTMTSIPTLSMSKARNTG
jgi:hypothetical protein